MSDRLVTVAIFSSPIAANIAKNQLEAAGLKVAIADEESVGMSWVLAAALGGIKLQVFEKDTAEALAVLGDTSASTDLPNTDRTTEDFLPNETEQPAESEGAEDVNPEPVLSNRDQMAERAFRCAIFGLLLAPIEFFAFWLLLNVYISDEPLSADNRWKAKVAAAINLPMMFFFCFLLRALIFGFPYAAPTPSLLWEEG